MNVCVAIRSKNKANEQNHGEKIGIFVNQFLLDMLGIQWMNKVSNKDLWERTNQVQIEKVILNRRWRWLYVTLLERRTATLLDRPWRGTLRARERAETKTPGEWPWGRDHAYMTELAKTGQDRPEQETLERRCVWPTLHEKPWPK